MGSGIQDDDDGDYEDEGGIETKARKGKNGVEDGGDSKGEFRKRSKGRSNDEERQRSRSGSKNSRHGEPVGGANIDYEVKNDWKSRMDGKEKDYQKKSKRGKEDDGSYGEEPSYGRKKSGAGAGQRGNLGKDSSSRVAASKSPDGVRRKGDRSASSKKGEVGSKSGSKNPNIKRSRSKLKLEKFFENDDVRIYGDESLILSVDGGSKAAKSSKSKVLETLAYLKSTNFGLKQPTNSIRRKVSTFRAPISTGK